MQHNKNNSAYTGMSLVELILAVCIIGIFAAVATIPFSRASTDAQLTNAADRLVNDLILVRDQARREQKPFSLVFNQINLSYKATGVLDINNADEISVNLIDDDRYKLTSIDTNIDDSSKTITFNKAGYPTVEGEITLTKGAREIIVKILSNGKIVPTKPN
ncbi:MAG: hypothetical protein GY869_07370 [Planctomycetes bacterium]|nr:hypothetical protein [Planctomycetota bacterium]